MKEWEKIWDYPMYDINESGRVRSWYNFQWGVAKEPRIMKEQFDKNGYSFVHLTKDGVRKERFVHHLLLEAFVSRRTDGMVCRHLDGDSRNNDIPNLKWGTVMENVSDRATHGTNRTGESHPMAKLTRAKVMIIRKLCDETDYSMKKIGALFGITKNHCGLIRARKTWGWLK